MKLIGATASLYALLLLSASAALANDSVDSLDSAIQKLSAGQKPTMSAPQQAPAPTPPLAPPIGQTIAAPQAAFTPNQVMAPAAVSQPVQTIASMSGREPELWVYEFSASWCPSCRRLAPVVEGAAAKYDGFIKFVPVNVDRNQALVRKLNVAQIPTVIVMDKNGRTLNRLVGLQQGNQISTILEHYKGEAMASVGVIQ